MNITIRKRDLLQLLTACEKVSDSRSAMPVLSHVLISTEQDCVRISATDLYLSATGVSPCTVEKSGSVAAPAKEFRERVKAMPDGSIQIASTAGGEITLSATGAPRRFKLHGRPGEDFPEVKRPVNSEPFSISTKTLAELLNRTRFSISTDETRPHVNSLLVELEPGMATAVSTDGHRLSLARSTEVSDETPAMKMLVPLKAVNELSTLIGTIETTDVIVSVSDGWAFFVLGGTTCLGAKLIEAEFPPYMQVIPKKSDHTLQVSRRELGDSLKAMQIAASDKTGGVKIAMGNNALKISASAPDSGSGSDEIETECRASETVIGLNAKYVLDIFGAIDDHRVELGLSGELDPVTVRISEDDSFVAVVMPMRIQ